MKIQSAVSRYESVRMQFAKSCWAYGEETFFLEKVPFSSRNGISFARKIVALFRARVEALEERGNGLESYQVVELGAGIGFLSGLFLDILQQEDPDLYLKTRVMVTDAQPLTIDHWGKMRQYEAHQERIDCCVMDAVSPTFDDPVFFVFSVYLLDCLDGISVEYDGNTWSEVVVESSIDDDAVFMDTTTYLPTIQETEGISKLLENPFNDKSLSQGLRLLELLKESYSSVPLDRSQDGQVLWESCLKSFNINDYLEKEFCRFNVPLGLVSHLKLVLEALHPDGMYLVSDFGFSKGFYDIPYDKLFCSYGLTCFNSVPFPLLRHVGGMFGFESVVTDHYSDQIQELVFVKQMDADFEDRFHQLFGKIGHEAISEFIEELEKDWSSDEFDQLVTLGYQELDEDDRLDYFLLKSLVIRCFHLGRFKDAYEFGMHMINLYGPLAVDALIMVGLIIQSQGKYEESLKFFDQVIELCPHYGMVYALCGASFMNLGYLDEAVKAFKSALLYYREDRLGMQLYSLGLVYRSLKDEASLQALYEWLCRVQKDHPEFVVEGLVERFEKLVGSPKSEKSL